MLSLPTLRIHRASCTASDFVLNPSTKRHWPRIRSSTNHHTLSVPLVTVIGSPPSIFHSVGQTRHMCAGPAAPPQPRQPVPPFRTASRCPVPAPPRSRRPCRSPDTCVSCPCLPVQPRLTP